AGGLRAGSLPWVVLEPSGGHCSDADAGAGHHRCRIARMTRWYGKVLGFIAGWLLMRHPAGGLIGLAIGHAFDSDWFRTTRGEPYAVLGLERDASDTEVDLAYRRLMAQYPP